MTLAQHTLAPEALRPRVEGDFANDRVKQAIMARLFDEPVAAAKIGRFTVLRELGRGGTGVVYAAYDEQLERKVAVKLLHEGGGDEPAEGPRSRLLREAQAMARLSHPHIVSVHEVGTHHGQVYIAMEFVHGVTLAAWLKAQPRSWREVVEVFRQAGSGLAAAHEAGLVHRDFKPQNAMVGDDGRVRVLDFGLARADGDPHVFADLERTRDSGSMLRALDASLTITGSLVGTPAYMAPEQFRGERADPRSDQFALCVALYEALFGERPFAGDTLSALMSAVLAGKAREPSGKVPRALRAAVMRGLQLRPEARHPSMEALLAAVDRVVEPRRRHWLVGAGLTLGLAAGAGGLVHQSNAAASACAAQGVAEIAAAWSPERAAAIEAALVAVDRAAGEAWPRAAARFDAWTLAWQQAREDACVAAEVRREQSQELYDLRRACLDHHLGALRSALDLFAQPDEIIAVHAADIADGLPALELCADPDELRRLAASKADPEQVAAQRSALARAETYRRTGKFAEALAIVEAALPDLARDDVEIAAEFELARGRLLATVGRAQDALGSLRAAYFKALAAAHDRLAVTAALELARATSEGFADFRTAELWIRHARALLGRGGGPALQAAVAEAAGRFHGDTGRHLDAQRELARAVDLYRQAGREDSSDAARARRLLADAAANLGDLDGARTQLEGALAVLRRDHCERHPEVAAGLHSLGKLALARGDLDQALADFDLARRNIEGVVTDDSHVALQLAAGAAKAHALRGETEVAEAMLRRALAASAGADAGLPVDRRTLRPEVYGFRLQLVGILTQRGELAAAEVEAREVLAAAESAWGQDEPHLSESLVALTRVLLTAGRAREAVDVAERAYSLVGTRAEGVHPRQRCKVTVNLARALKDAGDPRADEVIRDAKALAGDAEAARCIDGWLDGRDLG